MIDDQSRGTNAVCQKATGSWLRSCSVPPELRVPSPSAVSFEVAEYVCSSAHANNPLLGPGRASPSRSDPPTQTYADAACRIAFVPPPNRLRQLRLLPVPPEQCHSGPMNTDTQPITGAVNTTLMHLVSCRRASFGHRRQEQILPFLLLASQMPDIMVFRRVRLSTAQLLLCEVGYKAPRVGMCIFTLP